MKAFRVAVAARVFVCGIAFGKKSGQGPIARSVAFQSPAQAQEAEVQESAKQGAAEDKSQAFNTRCESAGVVVCQGSDSPLITISARWPAPGLYPGGDSMIHGKFDRSEKASGEGSLRFEILSHTGQNAGGSWRQPFGRNFGPGSTFYVQYRQRFSPEMLKNDWGDTTWKQVIFHNESATCGEVELTTAQYYHAGFPIMYTECGGGGLVTQNGDPT